MTNHSGRIYALGIGLVVFFLAWVAVAARPWASAAADPRLNALAAREARLRRDERIVNALVARRWETYRVALHARRAAISAERRRAAALAAAATAQIQVVAQAARSAAPVQRAASGPVAAPAPAPAAAPAPAPRVRIVMLPPLTITKTS
jgi:hypothetical protein